MSVESASPDITTIITVTQKKHTVDAWSTFRFCRSWAPKVGTKFNWKQKNTQSNLSFYHIVKSNELRDRPSLGNNNSLRETSGGCCRIPRVFTTLPTAVTIKNSRPGGESVLCLRFQVSHWHEFKQYWWLSGRLQVVVCVKVMFTVNVNVQLVVLPGDF